MAAISFENKYVGDKFKQAIVKDIDGVAYNVSLTKDYYDLYEKIANNPVIKNILVYLDTFEISTFDFTKPVWINEFGCFSMVLQLDAQSNGLCKAKLLLLNKEL